MTAARPRQRSITPVLVEIKISILTTNSNGGGAPCFAICTITGDSTQLLIGHRLPISKAGMTSNCPALIKNPPPFCRIADYSVRSRVHATHQTCRTSSFSSGVRLTMRNRGRSKQRTTPNRLWLVIRVRLQQAFRRRGDKFHPLCGRCYSGPSSS